VYFFPPPQAVIMGTTRASTNNSEILTRTLGANFLLNLIPPSVVFVLT
jgi:hypothetical protein